MASTVNLYEEIKQACAEGFRDGIEAAANAALRGTGVVIKNNPALSAMRTLERCAADIRALAHPQDRKEYAIKQVGDEI